MSTTDHIKLRNARDRLIDLLAIGQTYPQQDLTVPDDQLTVAFKTTAQIPIEDSQEGVRYHLYDQKKQVYRTPDYKPGGNTPIRASGTGERITLETYQIQEDITFEILAQATDTAAGINAGRTVMKMEIAIGRIDQQRIRGNIPRPAAQPILDAGISRRGAAANLRISRGCILPDNTVCCGRGIAIP